MNLADRLGAAWRGLRGQAIAAPPAAPRPPVIHILGRSDPYAGAYGNGSGAGFAGAAVSRLTASLATWSGSVNADLDNALPILRARARSLAANNEHGAQFLELVGRNVVGRAGPTLQVRAYNDQRNPAAQPTLDLAANAAIEAHWQKWGRTADITGHQALPALLRTIVHAVAREGEALVKVVRRRDLPYGLGLQVLDIDRLDEALNQRIGANTIRQGVEIDSSGRPVAYWLRAAHPGDNYATQAPGLERVPAADLFHLFLRTRPEQVRGITWYHAVIRRASMLGSYEEAALVAAQVGASKIAALERKDEDAPDDGVANMASAKSGNDLHITAEAGELFELPPGYSLNSWNPEYPHANFDSFLKACLRGLAAGFHVAAHNLTGDMTDVNFSSARIAELAERETWECLQDWLIDAFLQPLYQEWLALALLRGDITFPVSGKAIPADKLGKFAEAARFQGRRWKWVDPAKEEAANEKALANRTTSRTRLAAEAGDDWQDILAEIASEEAALEAAGLSPPPKPPASPAPAHE